LSKTPQDSALGGNYPLRMAETMLLHDMQGSASQPAGATIDWQAQLAAHDRWLRAVVLARLEEPQAVDEVMQEVALAAVAQRAPLEDVSRVGAWLYRLAIRQALLYRRRHGRQRKLVSTYARSQTGNQIVSHWPDPLDILLQDERQALVRQALGRLHRRDREILLLKYTEDWSYRELAEHLGLSENAIEARLHRARKRLRQTIIGMHLIEENE
jgi:RNA polymerase sigma-70 factor (ECF subfamily)